MTNTGGTVILSNMKSLAILNFEDAPDNEIKTYAIRNASRAVVFDSENNIALMFFSRENFHKLPGGGIDEGENEQEALIRECKEEAGVAIEIINEIGIISEIKKHSKTIQNSYCYRAKVIGEKNIPEFTQKEIEAGVQLLWVMPTIAYKLVKADGQKTLAGKYINTRELTILKQIL